MLSSTLLTSKFGSPAADVPLIYIPFLASLLFMDISPVDCPKIPNDFHLKLRTRFLKKLAEV